MISNFDHPTFPSTPSPPHISIAPPIMPSMNFQSLSSSPSSSTTSSNNLLHLSSSPLASSTVPLSTSVPLAGSSIPMAIQSAYPPQWTLLFLHTSPDRNGVYMQCPLGCPGCVNGRIHVFVNRTILLAGLMGAVDIANNSHFNADNPLQQSQNNFLQHHQQQLQQQKQQQQQQQNQNQHHQKPSGSNITQTSHPQLSPSQKQLYETPSLLSSITSPYFSSSPTHDTNNSTNSNLITNSDPDNSNKNHDNNNTIIVSK